MVVFIANEYADDNGEEDEDDDDDDDDDGNEHVCVSFFLCMFLSETVIIVGMFIIRWLTSMG